VFVDIDANTFNLDLKQVPAAITGHTRAIIPVHLFGHPVDMSEVMAIAEANNLWVIEDCAQAIGAEWQGKKVGSLGHIGCFSFYPTKNLGACGDGGAITTNDTAIAQQISILGDHGRKQGYYHEEIGVNSRLDAVQAAILSIKLQHLDEWNQNRAEVANRYHTHLAGVPHLHLPQASMEGRSVWNQYTTRIVSPSSIATTSGVPEADSTSPATFPVTPSVPPPSHHPDATSHWRDRVRQHLQQQGIGTMVYYPLSLHQQPVYTRLLSQVPSLPVAEQLAHQVLSLPMFPELTPHQQNTITQALTQSLNTLADVSSVLSY
ncbi:MAG: DegT/DnrJ/EryC1/StrS family aminotransferase, partial [Merismopedia sp. SIO2A8]|nr:DegT/DnrJ/EryC1/StrS family aminotransferase [Merismopedia sp. SIO2A8]